MMGRKGLPPVAPADVPVFPPGAPAREDVAMAYAAILGRETGKEQDLVVSPGLDWRGLMARFAGSEEFLTRVLPHLLAGTSPRSRGEMSDSRGEMSDDRKRELAAWMVRVASGPGLPTEAELVTAPSWPAMLAAWLGARGMISLVCRVPDTAEREVAAAWALDELAKLV